MSLAIVIIILLICLFLQGFFEGSEMAVVNADKYRLALGTDAGSARARSALHLVKHPAQFFSVTILGSNLCSITSSVVATMYIIDQWGEPYAPLAIALWPVTLIFGQIVPKSIYQHYADRIVLRIAPLLLGVTFALYPAVWGLSQLTDLLLGGVKKRHGAEPPLSREELELMLQVGRPEMSDVKAAERTLISRLFDLADRHVRQIMTPLVDVVSVSVTASRDEACRIMDEHGFSRVPVIDGRVFNVVGVLTGMDLLFAEAGQSVRDLMKPAYFVPEEMPLDDLLVAMKRGGIPMAVAVDEFGAATGIVTVEDLLEEVIGDIRDEHDDAPTLYKRIGRHKALMSGRLEIGLANERLGLQIPDGPYQTIAGFALHHFQHIPRAGEAFRAGRYLYRVTRASDRVVQEVEAQRAPERLDAGGEG